MLSHGVLPLNSWLFWVVFKLALLLGWLISLVLRKGFQKFPRLGQAGQRNYIFGKLFPSVDHSVREIVLPDVCKAVSLVKLQRIATKGMLGGGKESNIIVSINLMEVFCRPLPDQHCTCLLVLIKCFRSVLSFSKFDTVCLFTPSLSYRIWLIYTTVFAW